MPQIDGKQIADGSINGATKLSSGFLATLIETTGVNAFAADQSMGGNHLTNLADPVSASDAATKNYVDSVAQGLDVKDSVRAATTAPLPAVTYANGTGGVGATLTANANGALPAQDGVTLVLNDRILVKDQVAGLQNGLYFVSQVGDGSHPFILTRTTDADSNAEVTAGLFTFVEEGTTQMDSGWVLTTTNPITVGTSSLDFTQFSGAGSITAGSGLQKVGNTISVLAGGGISLSTPTAGSVNVKPADASLVVADPAGVSVQKADASLQTTGSGLSVKPGDATLQTTGSGLTVQKGDASLQVLGGGLAVKEGDASITTTGSGIAVQKADNSLQTTGSGLSVKEADASIQTLAGGIAVQRADASLQTTGSGLSVKPADSSLATSGSGLKANTPQKLNKNMAALVTTADHDPALSNANQLAVTPGGGGYVRVMVNGIGITIGDGTRTGVEAYFSSDGGVTAKAISALAAGDILYWNGSVAGYELAVTDRIDFDYDAAA